MSTWSAPGAIVGLPVLGRSDAGSDRFPNMTALAGEFAFADPDERFELLIDIFVDGLSRSAAQP